MIDFYHYEGQLKSYLVQFCNIFTGLKIQTGKGECDEPEFMSVPIAIGSRDRVVAALQAGNTQNKPFSLPMMAVNMSNLQLSQNRKGTGVVDARTYLPAGGVYPTDLRVIKRVMPIPYLMTVDLAICTSNTSQTHQILEQLLMLFDPTLQIQTSDAAFDWTKLATVELVGMSNEENYPAGSDRRIINWTLTFEIPIYISAPVDVRDDLVRKIFIQLGNLDEFTVREFNDDGELVPFANPWANTEVNGIDEFATPQIPPAPAPSIPAIIVGGQSFAFPEGSSPGYVIGTLSTSGAAFDFRFSATSTNISAEGYFNVSSTGVLTLTAAGALALAEFDTAPAISFAYYFQATNSAGVWTPPVQVSLTLEEVIPPVIWFFDTFDGALNTALQEHSPNIGPNWDDTQYLTSSAISTSANHTWEYNTPPNQWRLDGTGQAGESNVNYSMGMSLPILIPKAPSFFKTGFKLFTLETDAYWQFDWSITRQRYASPTDPSTTAALLSSYVMITNENPGDPLQFYFGHFGVAFSAEVTGVPGITPQVGHEYELTLELQPTKMVWSVTDVTDGVTAIICEDVITGSSHEAEWLTSNFYTFMSQNVYQDSVSSSTNVLDFMARVTHMQVGAYEAIPTDYGRPPAPSIPAEVPVFVLVSQKGDWNRSALTSPDGVTWTRRVMPSARWDVVGYNGDSYIALENSGGYTAHSPNGYTWTIGGTIPVKQWQAVAWNGSIWCAIANDNGSTNLDVVATSPDGVTWTVRNASAAKRWRDVIWTGSAFVAVGADGVMTSPDGITWTTRNGAAQALAYWDEVTVEGSTLVAVGARIDRAGPPIMTSTDNGVTWTSRTSSLNNSTFFAVAFGAGVFCAIGSGAVMTSPDGITWTTGSLPGGVSFARAIAWNGTAFCAIADKHIITSANGLVWTIVPDIDAGNSEQFKDLIWS